jgi:AraC family transcriptional regulator
MLAVMAVLQTIRSIDLQDVCIREVLATSAAVLPMHRHDCAHLTLIATGIVTDTAGEGIEVLHAGDLLFRPAGAMHENMVAEPGSRGVIVELGQDVAGSMGTPFRTDAEALGGLPFRLLDELHRDDSASPLILRGLVYELLGLTVRMLRRPTAEEPPRWLATAVQYIDEHYAEALSITEAARAANVSPVRLREALRRWYHRTFSTMLRERRIAAALALLEGGHPLHEIATRCGFYDQSHFTRSFRATRGVTPHRFRRG